jgi:hypothetical protein
MMAFRAGVASPESSAFHDARERLHTSTLMGISSDGKFETFSYCHGRRVFDVQDAPEHVRLRLGRSVNSAFHGALFRQLGPQVNNDSMPP